MDLPFLLFSQHTRVLVLAVFMGPTGRISAQEGNRVLLNVR
jgi:hypothetical protein